MTMRLDRMQCEAGVECTRSVESLSCDDITPRVVPFLSALKGAVFSFEHGPRRGEPVQVGFVTPPLILTIAAGEATLSAENLRGNVLLAEVIGRLLGGGANPIVRTSALGERLDGLRFASSPERTARPFVEVLVDSIAALAVPFDPHLGLYGFLRTPRGVLGIVPSEFGVDVATDDLPALLCEGLAAPSSFGSLSFPDEIFVARNGQRAEVRRYDFAFGRRATRPFPRSGDYRRLANDAGEAPANLEQTGGFFDFNCGPTRLRGPLRLRSLEQ